MVEFRRDRPDPGRDSYFVNYGGPSAVQINYGGAYAGANQFSGWAAVGAEQTIGGYQVVWQNGGNYTVWNTDFAGNYRSQSAVIAGKGATSPPPKPSSHQTTNLKGPSPQPRVETAGTPLLTKAGAAYNIAPPPGASGPLCCPDSAPSRRASSAHGFRSARSWRKRVSDRLEERRRRPVSRVERRQQRQFPLAGWRRVRRSWYAEMVESALHQDLNGDGTTGVTTASIEAIGSTSLTRVADSYFMNYGGPSPVQLFYGSAYAAAGQFGAWKPVAAEQAGGTYQVAWQNGTADQYLAWTVGGAGNYMAQTAVVAGSTWYLQTYENTVHQDLNHDGTIGAVTSMVEVSGATSLAKVADSYFMNYGGPSAVQVNYGGAYVGANQFSGWAAVGAEQTISGYRVVWQNGGNYTVWNTDFAGNYRSQSAVIAGNGAAFAALEASFQQDINHDGSSPRRQRSKRPDRPSSKGWGALITWMRSVG